MCKKERKVDSLCSPNLRRGKQAPTLTYVSLNTRMHHTHDTLKKGRKKKEGGERGIEDISRCCLYPGYTASPEVGSDN